MRVRPPLDARPSRRRPKARSLPAPPALPRPARRPRAFVWMPASSRSGARSARPSPRPWRCDRRPALSASPHRRRPLCRRHRA
ncbi:MAG: hypothetical protein FJX61_13710 [Alphaproteobacteria bacterium]|nr:hypothetical protein [Alphaproteobacteria bacterium]